MDKKIGSNLIKSAFLRNLILAFCAVVVFIFLVNVLLNQCTRHNKYEKVPNFLDMPLDQAKKEARKASLRIEVNDSLYVPTYEPGLVLTQMPDPGTHVKSGRRIFVSINSYRQKMVRIPYVTGLSLRQAKNNLEVVGLEIDKLVYREDFATNYVAETIYDGKSIFSGSALEAEQGSGITLVLGMRADESTVSVPKIVGFPLKEAKSRLWEAGLNLGQVTLDEDITLINRSEARVHSQSPEQGTRVKRGATVAMKLAVDNTKIEQGSNSRGQDR